MDDWNVRTLSTYLGEPGPKAKQRTDPDPAKTHWLQRVNFVLCAGNMGQGDKNGSTSTSSRRRALQGNFTKEPLAAAKKGEELGMKHNKELAPKMTDAGKLLGTREQLSDGPRDLFCRGQLHRPVGVATG